MYLLVILIGGCDGLMQDAKEKFQSLQNVIAILGDPEKRKVYDESGSVDAAVCCLSLHTQPCSCSNLNIACVLLMFNLMFLDVYCVENFKTIGRIWSIF
jgi:hypothetical protein